MNTIYFMGECMVELRAMSAATLHQSFAGDVYNSAVYLKRCFPEVSTSVITALSTLLPPQRCEHHIML